MDDARELLLLQICDSAFPLGAYAHSSGLETYVQRGLVSDEAGAWDFMASRIKGPLASTELLGMRLAHEAALEGDLAHVEELEELLTAARTPSEPREGSRRMAARFCKTAGGLLDGQARARFEAYATRAPHHLNTAYGVFAACAGIDLATLMQTWLYSQVSAMVVNCVKTVPLSQTAGQALLRRSAPLQGQAVEWALKATPRDLARSAPGLDARCIQHETLYSRLYMS